jgi:putative inorganic carbon (hco3(-)) transporter
VAVLTPSVPAPRLLDDLLARTVEAFFRPLHALICAPSLLFIATMALMLFHSPDAPVPSYDRFALLLLVFVVLLRACLLREPLHLAGPVTWPMLGLLVWALCGVLAQPYKVEIWSMFAARWLVPFVLYQLAAFVFVDPKSLRQFELFTLLVLGYLSLIAILFMAGMKDFIFPRYILDEGLGIHADRARGPFLQAVANGLALNLLGLLALDSFRRKRLRGLAAIALLAALPLAIVATQTRAVWASFAGSILILLFSTQNRRLRRGCLVLTLAGLMGVVALLCCPDHHRSLSERLEESSPVKFRMAVYQAGWEMFMERPFSGWNEQAMQAGLANRVSDFHEDRYYFHNTYIEILVRYGLIGLGMYLWIVIDLFRIGRKRLSSTFSPNGGLLDQQFRSIWPLMVLVYLVNGSFVGMNYQFVNGLLFTLAGMLAAQNRLHGKELNVLPI